MPYTKFAPDSPDLTEDPSLSDYTDDIVFNLMALRDGVMFAYMVGWQSTPSGADLSQPDEMVHAKGTERLKEVYTWDAGILTDVTYHYSVDSGSNYTEIGTLSLTYDESGNFTGSTWADA